MSVIDILEKIVRLPEESQEVSGVAERWRRTYERRGITGVYWGGPDRSEEKYEKLKALPPGATRADVATIVENDSWVGETCTMCKRSVCGALRIGDDPDPESATIIVCRTCAPIVAARLLAD